MKLKTFSTAFAALSLVATPVVVAAQPIATPLTQPAQESVEGDNALTGGSLAVALLAVVAAGLGIYAGVDGGNDNNGAAPVSP